MKQSFSVWNVGGRGLISSNSKRLGTCPMSLAHCWIMAITSSPDTASSHKKVRFLWYGFVPLAEYQGPKAKRQKPLFLDFPASS
jgi:hypothetical protein